MKKIIGIISLVASSILMLAVLQTSAQSQARFVEGIHFQELANPQKVEPTSDKAGEVVDFFSYGCPHCARFAPIVEQWKAEGIANVNFIESPISFGRPSWLLLAEARHIAEKLGVAEQMHSAMFDAVQNQRRSINAIDDIKAIFVDNGVNAEAFDKAANSVQVKAALRQSEQNAITYKINATPTVMVNGRYIVKTSGVSSMSEMLDVVDYLLVKDGVQKNASPTGTESESGDSDQATNTASTSTETTSSTMSSNVSDDANTEVVTKEQQ